MLSAHYIQRTVKREKQEYNWIKLQICIKLRSISLNAILYGGQLLQNGAERAGAKSDEL